MYNGKAILPTTRDKYEKEKKEKVSNSTIVSASDILGGEKKGKEKTKVTSAKL